MMVIVGASELELRRVRRSISAERVEVHGGRQFLFGTMRGRDVCLVKTGVGRKNAAAAARAIFSAARPGMVIIAGAAGALNPSLELGSVVVVERILRQNSPEEISCPAEWSCRALEALRAAGMQAHAGRCCQVRSFLHQAVDKQRLYQKIRADVIDMESAALGYELQRAGVPFVNIRVVSDTAGLDTADMAALAYRRHRFGRMAALLWLCLRPRELMRTIFFYRGMGVAAGRIAEAVSVVTAAIGAKAEGNHEIHDKTDN